MMPQPKDRNLLDEIGQILADESNVSVNDILLYAKIKRMSVRPSIFKAQGNHVQYVDPTDELTWPLLWLWEEEPADKRWAEIEYLIRDGRFTVTYTYPDEIDPDEDEFERRDRIVARHFGDKPIVYPPWDDSVGQTFKL